MKQYVGLDVSQKETSVCVLGRAWAAPDELLSPCGLAWAHI